MDTSKQSQTPRTRQFRLQRFFVALLVLWGLAIVLQTSSLLEVSRNRLSTSLRLQHAIDFGLTWRRHNRSTVDSPPEPSVDAGDSSEVSDEDSLHLSLLHEHCVTNANATLTWQFGSPGHQLANGTASNPEVVMHRDDPDLLQKLRQCPDVDIFLPSDLHGNGYCEDAVAYAKYLNSRLLPEWALSIKLFDPELGREVD